MTEYIHVVELFVSGGIVAALFKFAALVGRMQQKQIDQEKESKDTRERVSRLEQVFINGRPWQ